MQTISTKTTADLSVLLSTATFIGLRWESPYTPCTGITAVFRQERKHFPGAVFIAPWCGEMQSAKTAFTNGKVVPVPGADFEIQLGGQHVRVFVLMSADEAAPILYVSIPEDPRAFRGVQTPYDTPHTKRDSLLFALAVDALIGRYLPVGPTSPFVWAADWQCVPAMARQYPYRATCLHLHNLYDEYLGDLARTEGYDHASELEHRSVLAAGFAMADVVATVSRGFAEGVRREMLHTAIFAPHLQAEAHRIESVENANFTELDAPTLRLADELKKDLVAGARALGEFKTAARAKLPVEIREKLKGRTLVVAMGRAATQKLHCVVVEAAARIAKSPLGKSAFFVFATTDGDRDDQVRQDVIAACAARHPDCVAAYSGRIHFFGELMHAADLNVMSSLWEPFGGAYEGAVLPVGRAIDGLASQIQPHRPSAYVASLTKHDPAVAATGWLFREPQLPSAYMDLNLLLTSAVPSIRNATYAAIADACTEAVSSAITTHQQAPQEFASLVRNALELQRGRTWKTYDRMVELVNAAKAKRGLR